MTPTDFQRLPSRELTPQPYSQARKTLRLKEMGVMVEDEKVEWAIMILTQDDEKAEEEGNGDKPGAAKVSA